MMLKRTLAAAAAVALLAGVAQAQTTTAPAETPAPAAPAADAQPAPTAAPAEAAAPVGIPVPVAPAYTPIAPKGNIVATLKASGEFDTLIKALDAVNLTGLLESRSGLTFFAPTDAAFAALPPGELDRLMESDNAQELQGLLAYHLVNATVDTNKIEGAKGPVATVARAELLLDGTGEPLKANSAPILQSGVHATNGVIHVVGEVLSPSDPVIAQAKAEAAAAEAAAAEAAEQPAG